MMSGNVMDNAKVPEAYWRDASYMQSARCALLNLLYPLQDPCSEV